MNRPPLVAGGQGRHAREAIASATALVWCLAGAAILALWGGIYLVWRIFA